MDDSPSKQPRPPSAFGPPSLDFIGEDSDREWSPKHFQQKRKFSNLDPKAEGFKTDEIAWKIYKGGAALSFKPILPTFIQKEIGVTVERNGALLVEAAPMLAPRVYDWKSKIMFALTIEEIATVLAAPEENHNFVHDRMLKRGYLGKPVKALQIMKAPDRGWFFILKATSENEDEEDLQLSVAVSPAEYEVFKTNAAFIIPRLMGLDKYF